MSEIEAYIDTFPVEVQIKLHRMNELIRENLPMASEKMSYAMPTFFYHENVVHFAGYKKHIGFYPTPSAILAFKNELGMYKFSKGAVQFPLDLPLPESLIVSMVKYRLEEIKQKYNV